MSRAIIIRRTAPLHSEFGFSYATRLFGEDPDARDGDMRPLDYAAQPLPDEPEEKNHGPTDTPSLVEYHRQRIAVMLSLDIDDILAADIDHILQVEHDAGNVALRQEIIRLRREREP